MTNILRQTTADDDLLSNAQFDPVFDQDGNLVDIVHLEITTDRSRGIKAMLELANSTDPADGILYQDGWTGKQKRILNAAAPGPAHTIKRSKRWDAAKNAFVPTATLLLPFEVMWVLFEETFGGTYSIKVKSIDHESEDVPGSGVDGARDLPGRIFYARACVSIDIHLANGQTRTYEGIGVAYDSLKMDMTGNVYAINSARRTAEKGAVSDAKREALSNMGRVFRRAFEDGAEALRVIEEKLMERMRAANTPKKTQQAPRVVAAPRLVTAHDNLQERDNDPEGYTPAAAHEEQKANAKAKTNTETAKKPAKKTESKTKAANTAKATPTVKEAEKPEPKPADEPAPAYVLKSKDDVHGFETPIEVYDFAMGCLDALESADQTLFLEMNKTTLLKAEKDDELGQMHYQDLVDAIASESGDDTSDETTETAETPSGKSLTLSPDKMTGEAILKAYETAFATHPKQINAILEANTDLAKRLTKRQKIKLAQMASSS